MKNLHLVFSLSVAALYCLATTEAISNLALSVRYSGFLSFTTYIFYINSSLTRAASSNSGIGGTDKKTSTNSRTSSEKTQQEKVKTEDSEDRKLNCAPRDNSQNKMEQKSPSETLKDVPCDYTLKFSGITFNESVEKKVHTMEVGKILCTEMESRAGTGYIWVLLDIYSQEPDVDPSMFPVDIINVKDHVSDGIIATQPHRIQKPLDTDEQEMPDRDGNGDGKPTAYKGMLVGGSSTEISKIKVLKAGTYFAAYAFYRPFNPSQSPNIRILEINAQ